VSGAPGVWASVLRLSVSRLRSSPGLTLALLLGLSIAIGVITSIPVFVRGVNLVLLRAELAKQAATAGRPLFAMRFYHASSPAAPITIGAYNRLNQYLTASASNEMGLPVQREVRSAESVTFDLKPADPATYPAMKESLGQVSLGFTSDLASHVNVYEGSFPNAVGPTSGDVPVLVYEAEANETGLRAGERFILSTSAEAADGRRDPVTIPIIVAGIWKPTNVSDGYWFEKPDDLKQTFFVPEETYDQRVAPIFKTQFVFTSWYIVFDSQAVRTDDIVTLLTNTSRMLNRANVILPDTRLDYAPTDPLDNYRQRTELLTILLYVFSVPVVGLVLYFLNLISGLVVERRRGEIALLASRGAGPIQLLLVQTAEALILTVGAIPPGLLLGLALATLMGATESFLRFIPRPPLPVAITEDSLRLAALAAGLGLLTQVLPAIGAARVSIVRFKEDFARSLRAPFWQRYFLDVALLAVVAYGYDGLRRRGSLSVLGTTLGSVSPGGDPLREPILFVAPTLFVLALALFAIRLFPLVMVGLSWLSSTSRQVSWQLAFRNLSRSPNRYVGPLLLTILTLSLATFTASTARTLDQNTVDQVRYAVGADLAIFEKPDDQALGIGGPFPVQLSPAELARRTTELGGYLMPVSEQAKVPGVYDVTRVGDYKVSIRLGTGAANGRLLGIDRVDFPRIVFFRRDFAAEPLIGLMNDLARNNSAVLLPSDFAQKQGLHNGDYLPIQLTTYGGSHDVDLTVVGTYTYFPTVYPNQPPTLIANLDYIFTSTGEISPYDVWFSANPATPTSDIVNGLTKLGIPVATVSDERQQLSTALAQPERIGLFGMLSAGFLACAGLTALGFGLYTMASVRRRSIELGVLRSIGLSDRQMIALLLTEQTLIVVGGALIGLALGTATSILFIPFFRVGATEGAIVPPFQVIFAWSDVVAILLALAAVLLLTSLGIIYRLARLRIVEAVKLGEAV
jgi:putative ABC transport system permease protein